MNINNNFYNIDQEPDFDDEDYDDLDGYDEDGEYDFDYILN